MVELRERVFEFMKAQGPVIPIQISKLLGSDTFLASAVLGELLTAKRVKITNAAIGGSRMYYIVGQEKEIGERLYNYLKSRERDAFNLLRDNKVLRDRALEPWCRVALRDLKDFAFSFQVTMGDKSEIFWKFYLITDNEVPVVLNSILGVVEETQAIEQTIPLQEKIVEDFTVLEEEPVEEVFVEKNNLEKINEIQQKIVGEIRPIKEKKIELNGAFYDKVKQFFINNNIQIIEEKVVKKNKEFDFVTNVPSNIGTLVMYVKANNKKSLTDNDLTLAYAEAQQKRMIGLFLGAGKMTKKAEEVINKKFHGQIIFRKI